MIGKIKLGMKIFNAVKRSLPIGLDGTVKMAKNTKFSLRNPFILDAVPENAVKNLSVFEGKKLKTVCRVLDSENSAAIMTRYQRFCSRGAKGFSEMELQNYIEKLFRT